MTKKNKPDNSPFITERIHNPHIARYIEPNVGQHMHSRLCSKQEEDVCPILVIEINKRI